MPASLPVFSIVIPTYNRAHLIGMTLASVLSQDFQDFEVLVVDDGSKDDTEAVVKEFSDKRIFYYKKKNGERGAARNYGAAKARGSYVNFFDSDDWMYPNHLSVATELIKNRNEPAFFHLAYDFRTAEGTVTGSVNNFDQTVKNQVLFDNRLSCNGVFLRRDIALKFPFEENRVLASSEDWQLWIRLLSRFELEFSNSVTSSVVNHDQRSLFTIPAQKVVARDLFLIETLMADPVVMKNYGRSFNRFIAERHTFFMLSLSQEKQRREVLKWALRAFRNYPRILTSRRFLASIKNSILK